MRRESFAIIDSIMNMVEQLSPEERLDVLKDVSNEIEDIIEDLENRL